MRKKIGASMLNWGSLPGEHGALDKLATIVETVETLVY